MEYRIDKLYNEYLAGSVQISTDVMNGWVMRPRVPWMNETDDAILEFYAELDAVGFRIWLAPTPVWINLTQNLSLLDKSRDTISRRMAKLAEMELLVRVDDKRGYYRITDKGLKYVAGDLDADDLIPPGD